MKTHRHGRMLIAAGLGLALSVLTGCQTYIAGMTLPSGRYLEHYPQYFPQEPSFPLVKELAYQEETAGLAAPANRGPVNGGNVNPVPPFGGPFAPAPRRPNAKAEKDFRSRAAGHGQGCPGLAAFFVTGFSIVLARGFC